MPARTRCAKIYPEVCPLPCFYNHSHISSKTAAVKINRRRFDYTDNNV